MENVHPFLQKFSNQLMDSELINFDTEFRQLNSWDSLTKMAVVNMIEDEFQILISDEDFSKQITIQDLYSLIESKS
jgi:acyl carrier protein